MADAGHNEEYNCVTLRTGRIGTDWSRSLPMYDLNDTKLTDGGWKEHKKGGDLLVTGNQFTRGYFGCQRCSNEAR